MTILAQRIRDDGITITSKPAAAPAWASGDADVTWYRVTLCRGSRKLTTPFGTGYANGELTAEDVLECLCSDASSADQPFADWCGDYGHDVHSEANEDIYKRVRAQAARLRTFLGDAYDAYVFNADS